MLETELVEGDRGVPLLAVTDHGIEDGEELPQASDHGDFGRFALGSEALIEDADNGIPFGRAESESTSVS